VHRRTGGEKLSELDIFGIYIALFPICNPLSFNIVVIMLFHCFPFQMLPTYDNALYNYIQLCQFSKIFFFISIT